MRWNLLIVFALALWLGGCAAAFRESRPKVRVETDPAGAQARLGEETAATPADVRVKRSGSTSVSITKAGFQEHNGKVKKKLNAGWVTVDILTCIFPVALCIPLIVDAATGAWFNVEKSYRAKLDPESGAAVAETEPGSAPATPPAEVAAEAPAPTMSESERKAAARAAYMEGAQLQEKGNAVEALARFEAAQKLFDAPTHQLHIAQTLAATGRLVEAQEMYESLSRRELGGGAPEAFRTAQERGKQELVALRPRIPTLRIRVEPAPRTLSKLVIKVNDRPMPTELVGIARPVNPGAYSITAAAAGYRTAGPVAVQLAEGGEKTIDLKLTR
jgi:hypothetical protein